MTKEFYIKGKLKQLRQDWKDKPELREIIELQAKLLTKALEQEKTLVEKTKEALL